MFYLLVLWLFGNAATWLSAAMTLHPADSKKSKRIYWIGCIASSLLTLGVIYSQYCDDKVDKIWADEARLYKERTENRWQRELAGLQKQNLAKSDEIKALMGDEEAMKRSIENKNELINQLLTREIDPAIEEHYRTLPLQLRARSEGLDIDKKIRARYEKRMSAIYRLVVGGYDRWISRAKSEGQLSGEIQTSEMSPIEIGRSPNFQSIRTAPLTNGCAVWIHARPATVTGAGLSQSLSFHLYYNQPGSGNATLLRIGVMGDGYFVAKGEYGNLTFENYEKNTTDSADDDKEFLERIVAAINQAMGFVTREVKAATLSAPPQK